MSPDDHAEILRIRDRLHDLSNAFAELRTVVALLGHRLDDVDELLDLERQRRQEGRRLRLNGFQTFLAAVVAVCTLVSTTVLIVQAVVT